MNIGKLFWFFDKMLGVICGFMLFMSEVMLYFYLFIERELKLNIILY